MNVIREPRLMQTFRIGPAGRDWLDTEATRAGVSRSDLIRAILSTASGDATFMRKARATAIKATHPAE